MTYKNYLEKIKGFSPRTIEIYNDWAKKLDIYEKDYKTLLLSVPAYAPNTMRLIISAIISYYKYLGDDRHKELELPKKESKVLDFISYEEYKYMLSKINHKTNMGMLKRICVRLLFETGIRASELLQIRKEDIRGNRIKIHGKGRKERVVFMSEWLRSELHTYSLMLDERLFNFGYKNLYTKVNGLLDRKISPHMFRRGFAKFCYKKEISIYDISLAMGHSSIETTASYIRKDSESVELWQVFS